MEACREEIKKIIRDKSRNVFVIDQITYQFGVDVVREFDAFLNYCVLLVYDTHQRGYG